MTKSMLNLFVRVYKRRLAAGETLEEIDASYPALTEADKEEIHARL